MLIKMLGPHKTIILKNVLGLVLQIFLCLVVFENTISLAKL